MCVCVSASWFMCSLEDYPASPGLVTSLLVLWRHVIFVNSVHCLRVSLSMFQVKKNKTGQFLNPEEPNQCSELLYEVTSGFVTSFNDFLYSVCCLGVSISMWQVLWKSDTMSTQESQISYWRYSMMSFPDCDVTQMFFFVLSVLLGC